MLSRLQSLCIAGACLGGFAVSLWLDLHGALAVLLALSFAFFFSAALDRRTRRTRLLKRMAGWGLTLLCIFTDMVSHIPQDTHFFIALITAFLCAWLLAFDSLACWIIRNPEPEERTIQAAIGQVANSKSPDAIRKGIVIYSICIAAAVCIIAGGMALLPSGQPIPFLFGLMFLTMLIKSLKIYRAAAGMQRQRPGTAPDKP